MTGAGCLDCQIPAGLQGLVLLSLWAAEAGVPADAQTLVTNARCLECIPVGERSQVLIYLLAQLAGVTDVPTLLNNAKCYECIPEGMRGAAMIYLTNELT